MTLREFMAQNHCTKLFIDHFGAYGERGVPHIDALDAAGKSIVLEDTSSAWMSKCANAAVEGCLNFHVDGHGGGASVIIELNNEDLLCRGHTFFYMKKKLEHHYEASIDQDTLAKITGEKTYFADAEVVYGYSGGGDSFRGMDLEEGLKVDLNEGAFFDAFVGEYPSFNNDGGHGTIALNLHTGDYVHQAYSYDMEPKRSPLEEKHRVWFDSYDAQEDLA